MKYLIFIVIVILYTLPPQICGTQEVDMSKSVYDEKKGERVVEGLRFAIAEDRRVVRNGQYIEAEGLDKYLGRKFSKMFDILKDLSDAISKIENRLSSLEDSVEDLSEEMKSSDLVSRENVEEGK